MNRRQALKTLGTAALCLGGSSWSGCQRSRQITVNAWTHSLDLQSTEFTAALEHFARLHPDINLQCTPVTFNALISKINSALTTASLPDVFCLYSSSLSLLHRHHAVRDLGPFMRAENLNPTTALSPYDHRRNQIDGTLLALPNETCGSSGMLYIATELLTNANLDPTEPIANWDQLTDISRTLVRRLNRSPHHLEYVALDPFHGTAGFLSLVQGAGIPLISPDGRHSLLNQPILTDYAQRLENYVTSVYGPWGGYRGLLSWRTQNARQMRYSVRAFGWGTKAFMLSGGWAIGVLRIARPTLQYQIQPIPGFLGLHGGIASHGRSYAMRRDTPVPDAAWKVLRYLTIDPDGNGRLTGSIQRLSGVTAIDHGPAFNEPAHLWAGVRAAARLDMGLPAVTKEIPVADILFDFPMRRFGGEPIADILQDMHGVLQSSLDQINGGYPS